MIDTIAKYTGYDSNERTERRYMAKEYYLLNAIKDGRVINPKIVGFTCTLDESAEYLKVVKTLKKLESKDIKNGSKEYYQYEALRTLKEQMYEIIGKKGLNEEQLKLLQEMHPDLNAKTLQFQF